MHCVSTGGDVYILKAKQKGQVSPRRTNATCPYIGLFQWIDAIVVELGVWQQVALCGIGELDYLSMRHICG